jgi:hypothetical protein
MCRLSWFSNRKLSKIQEQLEHIEQILNQILNMEKRIMTNLETLTATVNSTEGVIDSTLVLLQGLSDYIKANATNPAVLLDLANSLEAKKVALADALVANAVPTDAVPAG